MFDNLDPTLLARIQFAFTVSFHILFPAFTIGLASWLAVLEWRWLKTGNEVYVDVYRMWVKIFAVTFGMGVVSGVLMPFQFGTNWSRFVDFGGNIFGPLLGYEVLTARHGKEAIEAYRQNRQKVAMVILDLIMPGMGGGETFDRLKEIDPEIKVLLSSGYSINGQATEILQRGCDGFIQKPFNLNQLAGTIQKILGDNHL